jgi:inner membrane protein involved in colicin E2 resistance
MCILKIVKRYKKFNIFFYLHPKEFYDKKLKSFFNDNRIKYNHYILPSELNILLNKKVPFKIFSIYSTSIFSFSKFLHPTIKLYNLDISVSAIRSKEEVARIKLIKDYIIKNSDIELIKI